MKDFNITIHGSRDQSRQSITFHVNYVGGDDHSIPVDEVLPVINELREWTETTTELSKDDRTRLKRQLDTVQDECSAETPLLKQIESAVICIASILEAATQIPEAVATSFERLAHLLGFTL